METKSILPGSVDVERGGADQFVLRSAGTQLARIRRGTDGWKLWLRSCEVEIGGRIYRTQAAMWQPEVALVDDQGNTSARDILSGTHHTVELNGTSFTGDGSHDVERWQDRSGATLLELRWQGTYAELEAIDVLQPIDAFVLATLAAFALHAGSRRGGDRQSW